MAKVSYIDIDPELEPNYWKGLQSCDRYIFSRVGKKVSFLSRKRVWRIGQRSLFGLCADQWNPLSEEEKNAWSEAGSVINMVGWHLFIQDLAARRASGLEGLAIPSLLHQSWIGQLSIKEPASELEIVQIHPRNYYVKEPIPNKRASYRPELVTEDLSLPFTLGLNYCADLEEVASGSFARFLARFWYSYQGENLYHDLIIPLEYQTDWTSAEDTLSVLETIGIRYDLYFHLYNVRGDLWIDNLRAEHSGQNWARDSVCRNIAESYTRAFYQVPANWSAITAPEGAAYASVYKDFNN